VIYVTHDQTEAMTMGTRIAVLKEGVLQQLDTPQMLYDYPVNMFVAGFIGSPAMNFCDARIVGTADDMWVDGHSFKVQVPPDARAKLIPLLGKQVFFGIRPEDIFDPIYAPPNLPPNATFRARVDVTELLGAEIFLYLLAGRQSFIARVDPRTRVQAGDEVELVMDLNKMHIFDWQTQEAYI